LTGFLRSDAWIFRTTLLVAANGTISIYNQSGILNAVVDVEGWYS
jgi:hypothetical protein